MHEALTASLLQRSDIPEATRLSEAAGWNQTETDWERLLNLNPDTCFVFRSDGRVAGTGALAVFGQGLAWIGMVIVDPPFRGQGIGKHILETLIQEARQKKYEVIGLDATDQGRRLYIRNGFHDVEPIDRWAGQLEDQGHGGGVQPLDEAGLEQAAALDRAWAEHERGPLLRHLFREEDVQALALPSREKGLRGFAFLRPGRRFWHLGPALAETEEGFAALLDGAARRLEGRPVLVDALRRECGSALLGERGLEIQRELTRMTLDTPRAVMSRPEVRAAVAFEWG